MRENPTSDSESRENTVLADGGEVAKVIGTLDVEGVGVLGNVTADTGTNYGVKGTATAGYGLYTPDDAKVDGTSELGGLAGALTGNTEITDLVGSGLSIESGALTASGDGTDTRTNVSDGGSSVVTDVKDIDFAANLAVFDDGDDTVTVETSGVVEELTGGDGIDPSSIVNGDTVTVAWGDATALDSGGDVTDWSGAADLDASGTVTRSFVESLSGGAGIDPNTIGDSDTVSVAWEDASDLDASGNISDFSDANDLDSSGTVTAGFIGSLSGGAGIDPSSIGDGDTLSVAWEDANDLDSSGNVSRRTGGRYLSGSHSEIDFSGPAEWGNDGQTNANSAGGIKSTVGGGYNNNASDQYATISGGTDNEASGSHSTVGGGNGNSAIFDLATVPGGDGNTASGAVSTVCGGRDNEASGLGATVTGGKNNLASGSYSFAHGVEASAGDDGAVVFGDSSFTTVSSTQSDQFRVQQEDVRLGEGNLTSGSGSPLVYSTATGQIRVDSSSARYKKNIEELSPEPGAVLELEPSSFEYEETGEDGVGLVAEEVVDHIPELVQTDEEGRPESVLYDRLGVYFISEVERQRDRIDDLESENETLRQENEDLRDRLNSVEDRLNNLESGQPSPAPADD